MDNIENTKNKAEEKKPHKLFDYCMSNPPYQVETQKAELKKGCQKTVKSVFPVMQEATDSLTRKGSVLVYPAGRWIQRSGKGMQDFGLKQINDPHLSTVVVYPDSKDVFPGIDIADGISIVSKRMDKESQKFNYGYKQNGELETTTIPFPGDELLPMDPKDVNITTKISDFCNKANLPYFHDRILPRSLFGIESDFIEKNPEVATPLDNINVFDDSIQVKLFTNDKAGKRGRTKWFVVDKDIISSNQSYIEEFQVVVSSANAGGQKANPQLEIIDNHSAFGRARIALSSFKTAQEANNLYRYVSSCVIRFAFLITGDNLSGLGKLVPDVIDYTSSNPLIDFSGDIDSQLCSLIGFTGEEFEYIKKAVKERGHWN